MRSLDNIHHQCHVFIKKINNLCWSKPLGNGGERTDIRKEYGGHFRFAPELKGAFHYPFRQLFVHELAERPLKFFSF